MTDLPCACATARQLARTLTHLYDARLRGTGVEAPQFTLMLTLEKAGPSSQVDLARRYALDKTTVSRNLRLLERKGWIESAASKDKRKRQFVLTAAGRKRLEAAKPKWKKAQDDLKSTMSAEEWDAMFQVFRNVAQAAQNLSV
jgi:DNA-binding MarR family transcriptional regulator